MSPTVKKGFSRLPEPTLRGMTCGLSQKILLEIEHSYEISVILTLMFDKVAYFFTALHRCEPRVAPHRVAPTAWMYIVYVAWTSPPIDL